MPSLLRLAAVPDPSTPARSPKDPIRVVLADDHAIVRRSLRRLLDSEDGLVVIAEASDLTTVSRHVHGHQPHVLVLDLGMPNGTSVETIRRLRSLVPDTQIVVLTMNDDPVFARHTLDAGAVGFVLKEMADSDLPAAIRNAARGEEYVSPRLAIRLESQSGSFTHENLSRRETEVLRLIALGYTSVEIADELHLSPRTIETHRARIHRKLGLTTRAELVRYALGRGLLSG